MYKVSNLDARPQADNPVLHGGNIYGLEVTIPALASYCDLGNIDPQHTERDAGTAAIEVAVHAQLPPAEATLVTVRPDADSLGAMAVLMARAEHGDSWVSSSVLTRINQIAISDKEAAGPWPGVRPLGEPSDYVNEATLVNSVAMTYAQPLAERVALIGQWLQEGEFDGQEDAQARLLEEAAIALRTLKVHQTPGGVAVVEGDHRLAMNIGYRLAPVVLAVNQAFRFAGSSPHRKYTVARWNSSIRMDWDGLERSLNDLEPGWGGSSSIIGSPQGIASKLETSQVIDMIEKTLPHKKAL